MMPSQFAGPWGERKVQVCTTSRQCRFNPVLSRREERDFGGVLDFAPAVELTGSWVRIDTPLRSIGADRVQEQ